MKNKSIIMVFCLLLMLWAGSASAETNETIPADNNTQVNDTPPSDDLPPDNTGDDAEVDDGSEVDTEDPVDDGSEVDTEDPVDDGSEVDTEDPADDSEEVVDDGTDDSVDDGNETVDEITDEILPPTDDEIDDEESDDDIPPYEGAVGPGHALYGLRIAFENVGYTFTYNESERLGKQVSAARHRIAEAKHMMKKGDDEAVDIAMNQYKNKMKNIESSLDNATDETALTSAQQKLNKHQRVLEELAIEEKSKGRKSKYLDSALQENQKVDEKFQMKKLEKSGKSVRGKDKMTDENLTVNKTDDSKRGKGRKGR